MTKLIERENFDLASIPLVEENIDSSYVFPLAILTNYKKILNGQNYQYYINNETITKENNYFKWLYLQAFNCLVKIYLEQSEDDTIVDIHMSEVFFKALMLIIANINNDNFTITVSFDDSKIESLIPSLCSYIALTYQDYDEKKVRDLETTIAAKLNKNIYQIFTKLPHPNIMIFGQEKLKSSIPFIELNDSIVGIEFLDENKKIGSLVNIYLKNKNTFLRYYHIFIKLDPKYIKDTKTKEGRLYRQGVAKILLDQSRAERVIEKRAGYFGIIELDQDKKQVNKLIEADTLYESDMIMAIKKYKNIHNIASYIE